MFRFYYLMRLLGTLPPVPPDVVTAGPQPWCNLIAEDQGQDEPQVPHPLCVVWQEGITTSLYTYQPSHGGGYEVKAYEVTCSVKRLLGVLKPQQSIYIFDPDSSTENVSYLAAAFPTLATCSPNVARSQEFMKHRGTPLYMPSHTKDELLTLAAFLEKTAPLESRQLGLLAVRDVIPTSQSALNLALRSREAAIKKTTKETLLSAGTTIDAQESGGNISHFVMHFKVDKSFQEFTLGFSSPSTEEALWC